MDLIIDSPVDLLNDLIIRDGRRGRGEGGVQPSSRKAFNSESRRSTLQGLQHGVEIPNAPVTVSQFLTVPSQEQECGGTSHPVAYCETF